MPGELRDQVQRALNDSEDYCARCQRCDRQLDAVMTAITCGPSQTGLIPDTTLGPCILRVGHDGPVHEDDNGVRWSWSLGDAVRDPELSKRSAAIGELRDHLAEAIREVIEQGGGATVITSTVMTHVGAAYSALRDEAIEQRQRAEQAEDRLQRAVELASESSTRAAQAEAEAAEAEAAIERVESYLADTETYCWAQRIDTPQWVNSVRAHLQPPAEEDEEDPHPDRDPVTLREGQTPTSLTDIHLPGADHE